jgi:hypothetical protein
MRDLELTLKNNEYKARQERDRLQSENNELQKQITRIQSKET